MRCELVTDWGELERHRDAWWSLWARSGDGNATLTPVWLGAWWRVFGAPERLELRALLCYESGRLVGMLLLHARKRKAAKLLPLRRLELVGAGEDQRDEICSDYIGLLVERGHEAEVAMAIATAVRERLARSWDEIALEYGDGSSDTLAATRTALEESGFALVATEVGAAHYAALPASFDGYLSALPSRSRALVRRSMRDMDAFAGGKVAVHVADGEAAMWRGFEVLAELHEARWRNEGQRGVFASERFRRFHELVLPELLARGELDLSWLEARGEPMAALYNIACKGKVLFYQSGRRMDLPAKLRPGIAAHGHAIARAIAQGRREYDFLSGTARYKRELGVAARPIVELRIWRRGSYGEHAAELERHLVALKRRLTARMRRGPSDDGGSGSE